MTGKRPNKVRYSGKGEPPRQIKIGMTVIPLPDPETQRKGFPTEHARALVSCVRGYKYLTSRR